jgi:hypothetical protein
VEGIGPGLRNWREYEDKAVRLSVWSPGIIHGLFQVEAYARAMIAALPGVSDEVAAARLKSRMERQRRVLYRDDPCVETASDSGEILVRDTTDRDAGMLSFTAGAWQAFVTSLRG